MDQSPNQIRRSILASSISIDDLAILLNQMSHQERLKTVESWDKAVQKKLYNLCEGRVVTCDDIVPPGKIDTEVIQHGHNSLPMFSSFQKRFAILSKDADKSGVSLEDAKIIGYNHIASFAMAVVTPGYFRGYADTESGQFIINYYNIPDKTLSSWPSLMPNENRLGRFVYAKMIDKLWKVSDHVTIGRAYKKEPMQNWFVLVRED